MKDHQTQQKATCSKAFISCRNIQDAAEPKVQEIESDLIQLLLPEQSQTKSPGDDVVRCSRWIGVQEELRRN